MEGFKIEYIESILVYLSLIMSSASVITLFVTVFKKVQSPEKKQNERIKKLEERLNKIDEFLEHDKQDLDHLAEGNRVTMEALSALLGHGMHGNNDEEMRKAKEKVNTYLTSNI